MMIGNMSTDDCGDVTLFINTTTFDCSNIGMNTVLLSVSDAAGNVSTDEAIVTVEDGISPVIVCPENIISNSCNGVDYDSSNRRKWQSSHLLIHSNSRSARRTHPS